MEWKLVPVEPTQDMLLAYKRGIRSGIQQQIEAGNPPRWHKHPYGYKVPEKQKAVYRWKAMVAAAPLPTDMIK